MSDNKKVLAYCPNFYKIIDFKPITNDEITDKLIRMYKEYIFKVDINNEDNISEIKRLDEALSKYIDDELEYAESSLQLAFLAAQEAKLAFLEAVAAQKEYDEKYGKEDK